MVWIWCGCCFDSWWAYLLVGWLVVSGFLRLGGWVCHALLLVWMVSAFVWFSAECGLGVLIVGFRVFCLLWVKDLFVWC